jgi:DNA-binding MarR family transcriptional regulator
MLQQLASTQAPPPSISAEPDQTSPDSVTDALLTASRALVAVAASSLAAIDDDVTLPQYRALVVLASLGPQTVGQLAEALELHASTVTRLCDRLVAKKLVRRAVSRGNRRETSITLSAAGREVVQQVTALRRSLIASIVGRIPEALREPAVQALNTFSEAAGEVPHQAWTLGWS